MSDKSERAFRRAACMAIAIAARVWKINFQERCLGHHTATLLHGSSDGTARRSRCAPLPAPLKFNRRTMQRVQSQAEARHAALAVPRIFSFGGAQLAPSTQRTRRQLVEAMLNEPTFRGAQHVFGDFPLGRLEAEHMKVLRDRKRRDPQQANVSVKILRTLFKWSIENGRGGLRTNPARDVPKLRSPSDGCHAWTEQDRERFVQRHRFATKARLAFALLFHTGQRRSGGGGLGQRAQLCGRSEPLR